MNDSSSAGWTPEETQRALQEILARAGTDPAFRDVCLTNSKAAVKEASHRELPEGYHVRFVDNERADLTVVLPDLLEPEKELSDDDLEVVAGGAGKTAGRHPYERKIDPV